MSKNWTEDWPIPESLKKELKELEFKCNEEMRYDLGVDFDTYWGPRAKSEPDPDAKAKRMAENEGITLTEAKRILKGGARKFYTAADGTVCETKAGRDKVNKRLRKEAQEGNVMPSLAIAGTGEFNFPVTSKPLPWEVEAEFEDFFYEAKREQQRAEQLSRYMPDMVAWAELSWPKRMTTKRPELTSY